jgi:hypothetical protein
MQIGRWQPGTAWILPGEKKHFREREILDMLLLVPHYKGFPQ